MQWKPVAQQFSHFRQKPGRTAARGLELAVAIAVFAFVCGGPVATGPALAVESAQPAVATPFPVASGARVAGDLRQTRFVLDLDRKLPVNAFVLADPNRVVLDVPQIAFRLPAGAGEAGRGLVKAFRYGLVMPGGSRIVMDLAEPARIEKAYAVDAENGQPARLIVELAAVSRQTFLQDVATSERQGRMQPARSAPAPVAPDDPRPLVVIDPGHGGIDTGTVAASGENEKAIVLDFALALRDRIEKAGKFRVLLTRADDTFLPLGERVRIARANKAALFISVHADALPRAEGDAQGATVYTLSETASDAEAARLAESENRADAIAGIDLSEGPADVADILIDLTQRETRAFSTRFARNLVHELKSVARLHRQPLKSAGFKVLKAPDVPSVLVELGYVSNKQDLSKLVSTDWRARSVASVALAIEGFFAKRIVATGAPN
jgi:N-acetylmuramoyl-L-alanine amidase